MKADFRVAISVPFTAGPVRGKPRAEEPKRANMPPRPSRIAVLMALAIHMEQLLRDGHVKDQAELAKLAGVTRARVTQVMRLLQLAPDIQEQLLFFAVSPTKLAPAIERSFRSIMQVVDWEEQRRTIMESTINIARL